MGEWENGKSFGCRVVRLLSPANLSPAGRTWKWKEAALVIGRRRNRRVRRDWLARDWNPRLGRVSFPGSDAVGFAASGWD